MELPGSFLPPTAPQHVSVHKIDFMKTNPPLPEYKDCFALVIDNFLTESECRTLLQAAEAHAQNSTTEATGSHDTRRDQSNKTQVRMPWARTLFGTDGDMSRNCGRIVWDTPLIAHKLFARLFPFLIKAGIATVSTRSEIKAVEPSARNDIYRVSRLNERLRFLKYERGEFFKPHWDAIYESLAEETSLFTIHLYLNGDGDQDLEQLEQARQRCAAGEFGDLDESEAELPPLGGATSFQSGSVKDVVRIFPKTGSLLVFQQKDLLHAGDDVYKGVKYTMRTDIFYRKDVRFQ
ncbi:uncharacterized protein ACLA_023290 [Aspergillus clavatus NRRL 1]|uniref:Prolyl 4-hydroxylase alpha subunit domain-containing protein n=1 Tax=Aspergillus clavatus (strain ATCC 1007 / CBS 513.65 / DSM 816 / NCTC 3887 / NRRL 1 / QM 1276 / 107) TaxID=344612 RepID=A1CPP4_ASPCL|nr:uncharacterized protein ACLA_023290 [Aspergillus clavatus NRRL 1]EAW07615.1 conserved hypothetical protein [Aspergillus clavatus NRRL 1]